MSTGYDQAFDEDYLFFHEPRLGPERSRQETETIWQLLDLKPGLHVLDCPCGHGRIANLLAVRGIQITGLDSTSLFLHKAEEEASSLERRPDYVAGDMRKLPFAEGSFDRVLSWFTSFGYFEDADNRTVLAEAYRVLRPGGLCAVEAVNYEAVISHFRRHDIVEREGSYMLDEHRLDELAAGRVTTRRTVIHGARSRSFEVSTRMFTPVELCDWFRQAGFIEAKAYGDGGAPYSAGHHSLVVVGRK